MAKKKTKLITPLLTAVFLSTTPQYAIADTEIMTRDTKAKTVITAPIKDMVATEDIQDSIRIAQVAQEMTEWRHDLHAHPETAYEENRTADKVNKLLQSWGIKTHTGIGKTGVVGVLKGKNSSKNATAICLRADMDALPITESNQGLEYSSTHDGKMHACGHDGHTAMLLGAAKRLSQKPDFSGTVYFIFQPAEEGGAGAKAMIDDGLFDIVKNCHSIYGMHTWPALPAGQVGITEGNISANSDRFTIEITGKGGHAAYPANNIDIVSLSAEIVTALHDYKEKGLDENNHAVLAITSIHGGESLNAMPETLKIGGTVRTFTTANQDKLDIAINTITKKIADKYGATVVVSYKRGYPSVFNADKPTAYSRQAASQLLGAENVVDFKRTMAGEDFAYYAQKIPGSYIALGQWDGVSEKTQLHSPNFNFNDKVLNIGASYWVNLVKSELPMIPVASINNKAPKLKK